MSKSIGLCLLVVCFGVGIATSRFANADDAKKDAPTTQPAAVNPKPVNTKCPVTGEDIDPSETIVYKGKTIAFCCADCQKAFNKDPEKYVAKMK